MMRGGEGGVERGETKTGTLISRCGVFVIYLRSVALFRGSLSCLVTDEVVATSPPQAQYFRSPRLRDHAPCCVSRGLSVIRVCLAACTRNLLLVLHASVCIHMCERGRRLRSSRHNERSAATSAQNRASVRTSHSGSGFSVFVKGYSTNISDNFNRG